MLQELREHTRMLVESTIESEMNYHFTNDLDFKESRLEKPPPIEYDEKGVPKQQAPAQEKSNGSNSFVKDLRIKIDSYFALVLRNVRDSIPKTIGYFLVKKSQEVLSRDLSMKIVANS